MASFSTTLLALPGRIAGRVRMANPLYHSVSCRTIITNDFSTKTTLRRKTHHPLTLSNTTTFRRHMSVRCTGGIPLPPLPSLPPNLPPVSWKLWLVGLAMALAVPFWRKQLWSDVKQRFDEVVNTVEKVADVVEDVAERVEKVADEIGNNLPAGNFKDAFQFIEDVADKTERSAELAGDVIDKVQELEEKVDAYIEASSDIDSLCDEHAKAKELKKKIEETKSKIGEKQATGGTSTNAQEVVEATTSKL